MKYIILFMLSLLFVSCKTTSKVLLNDNGLIVLNSIESETNCSKKYDVYDIRKNYELIKYPKFFKGYGLIIKDTCNDIILSSLKTYEKPYVSSIENIVKIEEYFSNKFPSKGNRQYCGFITKDKDTIIYVGVLKTMKKEGKWLSRIATYPPFSSRSLQLTDSYYVNINNYNLVDIVNY